MPRLRIQHPVTVGKTDWELCEMKHNRGWGSHSKNRGLHGSYQMLCPTGLLQLQQPDLTLPAEDQKILFGRLNSSRGKV